MGQVLNYVNYFTEIEQRFSQRRGSILMLSTLDWALIETWREAGIPLEVVLRGIDNAFDKHDAKVARGRGRIRKVNGLAWATQSVFEAAEARVEAATGLAAQAAVSDRETGFEMERVAGFLEWNAAQVEGSGLEPGVATRLRELAASVRETQLLDLEDLDRVLTVLEEKLYSALLAAAPEEQLVELRAQADRELTPHRARMGAVQIRQVQAQFLQKRLLEAHGLPRLSLFYMSHA